MVILKVLAVHLNVVYVQFQQSLVCLSTISSFFVGSSAWLCLVAFFNKPVVLSVFVA